MIEIGEKPILWHIMKYYSEFGYHDFVICLGYKQYVVKEFFADWSWKEKTWLAFVLIVQTAAWAIQKESLFMLVMTLTSSLNLVLGAKGKVAGLYFAIINSALYAINCMGIPLYGEVMYNLIYSIPVSAIAIFTWKKNMTKGGEVKFRTMTPKIIDVYKRQKQES